MTYPRTRLSRRSAVRLLDGEERAASEPLGALMVALTATAEVDPGREATASARFRRAASGTPVRRASRVPVLTRVVRRAVAAPVAAIAAASLALGGGGLAIAASQGAIDVPFTGHDNRSDRAPSAPSASNPGLGLGTAGPQGGEDHGTETAGATPGAKPSGTPSPSLPGLCRAFQAGAYKVGTTSPAWKALVRSAGGAEEVAAFCTDLIGPAAKPTKPPKPTRSTSPTPVEATESADPTRSAVPPSGRPTGRPTQAHSKSK